MAVSANIGDQVVVDGVIKNKATNTEVDPTTVKAWTRSPAGTVTTYTYNVDGAVTKSATGTYVLTFDVDTAGTWWCGFYSTGTGKGASDDFRVDVQPSKRTG